MTIPAGETGAGTYLPTWNGHGDALALWRQNADGTLTLANSYTYGTWGTPVTATHNGISDLGFRFLYVGAADVQWDDVSGAGLLYMHARHYSPLTGRFLQPDPSAAEANLYGYAGANPVSGVDAAGLLPVSCGNCGCLAIGCVAVHLFGGRGIMTTVSMWRQPMAVTRYEGNLRYDNLTTGSRRNDPISGFGPTYLGGVRVKAAGLYRVSEPYWVPWRLC